MRKIYIATIAAIVIVSCSTPPPKDSELVLLRNEIQTTINEYRSIDRTDINALIAMEENRKEEEVEQVIHLIKGEKFTITSSDYADMVLANDIGISIPGNRGIATKDCYISYLDESTMIYSDDGETWYEFGTDLDKKMMNVITLMNFIYEIKEEEQTNNLNWSQRIYLNKEDSLIELNKRINREVYEIEEGLVLTDAYLQGFKMKNRSNNVDIDLEKSILAVKEGTILTMDLSIDGNLIRGTTEDGIITLEVLENIYYYTSGTKVGFSFDNLDWTHSLFSFDIEANMQVEAISDTEIYAEVVVDLNYNE